jgi:aspartate kinase
MAASVPIWVRNTYSTAPGTLITDAERLAAERRRRVATAVSHADGIARIIVAMSPDEDPGARMRALTRVFRAMADAGASLDMFTPVGSSLVFSLTEAQLADAIAALDRITLPYEIQTDLAKVTLVGAGMHGVPGVMARTAEALAAAGVDILQIADSHYTISVLVHQEVRREAIKALHDEFGLGE